MKHEDLPEIPKIWIDFIHSRFPFLTPFPTLQVLLEHKREPGIRSRQSDELFRFLTDGKLNDSAAALKNIQKLRQPEAVIVLTNFYVSLFGGPAFQILKCLTAIKVCEELAEHSIEAVPLCWVSAESPAEFAGRSITLLDHKSELHTLKLNDSESTDHLSSSRSLWNQVSEFLSKIEAIGQGAYDAEILRDLKSIFVPEADFASTSARLISSLTSEWGMLVLNAGAPDYESAKAKALARIVDPPGRMRAVIQKQAAESAMAGFELDPSEAVVRTFCVQNSLLPVLGIVLDPFELCSCVAALPVLAEAGLPRPVVWPQPNVTITDSRRNRILTRYNLGIRQLYSGEEEVTKEIRNSIPCSAVEILGDLKSKVDECILELESLAPNRKKFIKKSVLCGEKILYQLEKLRKHYADACTKREQTVNRQMHKACNLLAPNRRLQERELAGILIPLRYSRAGLRSLYEKLDISKIGHQIISMD